MYIFYLKVFNFFTIQPLTRNPLYSMNKIEKVSYINLPYENGHDLLFNYAFSMDIEFPSDKSSS